MYLCVCVCMNRKHETHIRLISKLREKNKYNVLLFVQKAKSSHYKIKS